MITNKNSNHPLDQPASTRVSRSCVQSQICPRLCKMRFLSDPSRSMALYSQVIKFQIAIVQESINILFYVDPDNK